MQGSQRLIRRTHVCDVKRVVVRAVGVRPRPDFEALAPAGDIHVTDEGHVVLHHVAPDAMVESEAVDDDLVIVSGYHNHAGIRHPCVEAPLQKSGVLPVVPLGVVLDDPQLVGKSQEQTELGHSVCDKLCGVNAEFDAHVVRHRRGATLVHRTVAVVVEAVVADFCERRVNGCAHVVAVIGTGHVTSWLVTRHNSYGVSAVTVAVVVSVPDLGTDRADIHRAVAVVVDAVADLGGARVDVRVGVVAVDAGNEAVAVRVRAGVRAGVRASICAGVRAGVRASTAVGTGKIPDPT